MTDKFILDLDAIKIIGIKQLPGIGWSHPESSVIYYQVPGDAAVHSQTVEMGYEEVSKKIWTAKELNRNSSAAEIFKKIIKIIKDKAREVIKELEELE